MSELRIDVADLLAHRGARRVVRLEAPVDGLVVSGVRIDAPLVLDRTMQAVIKGREQLQAVVDPLPPSAAPADGGVGDLERIYDDDDSPIFDQDDL